MTPRSKAGNWTNGFGKVAWRCAVGTAVCQHVSICVLQVLVSHVTDSEDGFHVYLQQSERLVQLEQLLDRLDDVYSAADDDADTTATYRHGDAVAVRVATIWQRATVLRDSVSDDKTVKVLCVDYGSVHDVDVSKVRRLRGEMMSEPLFALRCQLFGVTADTGMMAINCTGTLAVLSSFISPHLTLLERAFAVDVFLSVKCVHPDKTK